MVVRDTSLPIRALPGTDPTDPWSPHWKTADKIRFVDGYPQKIGGWDEVSYDDDVVMSGVPRAVYPKIIDSKPWYLIGTHTRLYANLSSAITNITPLVTSTTALSSDPIETQYEALGTDPVATVDASTTVTITFTAHPYVVGDIITISGVSGAINGIPDTEFNTTHLVRTVPTANTFTILSSTAATSTGSGGGASVIAKSGLITITDTAHGFSDGERVGLLAATDTGGITAAQINKEHIIRNATTNTYDVLTSGVATSSATGGGASVTRQGEIEEGRQSASYGRGFGVGRFGVGRFGVALTSTSSLATPRVWSFDSFGNDAVMTPGGQTGVYVWDGDTSAAPTLLTNAPTAVEYVFVRNNIVVTLGAAGVPNRIKNSGQGDATVWTPAATNLADEDDVEGAGKFICHAPLPTLDIIFTESQCWGLVFDGGTSTFAKFMIDPNIGIIGRNARVVANGIAYFMGSDCCPYACDGTRVYPLPGNKTINGGDVTGNTTVAKYVADDINAQQSYKIHLRYDSKNKEIWYHYPSSASSECDRYFIYSLVDRSTTVGTMSRSCAESPHGTYPYIKALDYDGTMYRHEIGDDDGDGAMSAYIETNFQPLNNDTHLIQVSEVIPFSTQTGDISFTAYYKDYPQSANYTSSTYTVTDSTDHIDIQINSRYRRYRFAQNVLGGKFRIGEWKELLTVSTRS